MNKQINNAAMALANSMAAYMDINSTVRYSPEGMEGILQKWLDDYKLVLTAKAKVEE